MRPAIKITMSLGLSVALVNAVILPAAVASHWTVTQKGNEKKWTRQIRKSPSSDFVPMAVYLLDRHVRNASDKTEFDRAVDKAMAKGKHRRDLAARLVKNFQAIPAGQRQAAFGKFADPFGQTIPAQQIKDTVMRALRASRPDRATNQPDIPGPSQRRRSPKDYLSERPRGAEPPPSPEFGRFHHVTSRGGRDGVAPSTSEASSFVQQPLQIRYEGLYCREEAFTDQSSNSDEIYIITTAIDVATGEREADPMLHPVGSHHYEDMDTGEIRVGPVVSVYTGRPKDLTLIVTMMEFDFGDPNAFRDEVRIVVDIALAVIGAAVGGVVGAIIGAGVGELIVDLVNGILDTGDDLIEAANVFLSEADLRGMWRQPLRERSGDRDDGRGRRTIQFHFNTRHNENEDADYSVLFRVHDPNLHAELPPPRADVAPPDLIVTRIEASGTPTVTPAGIEVPLLVEVRNAGIASAGIFKIEIEYSGRARDFQNVPFSVPGHRDTTFPFTRVPLTAGRTVIFSGRLLLPLPERGTRISLRAFADSCGGDEFLPDYCRVRESDERNNRSRAISVSLPR